MSEWTTISGYASIPVGPPDDPIMSDQRDAESVYDFAENDTYYARNKRSCAVTWTGLDITSAQILVGLLDPARVDDQTAANTGHLLKIDNGAGYAAGVSTIHIDNLHHATATLRRGWLFTISGAHPVYMLTASASASGNECNITFTPALLSAVSDNDELSFLSHKFVKMFPLNGGGYAVQLQAEGLTWWSQVNQRYTKGYTP